MDEHLVRMFCTPAAPNSTSVVSLACPYQLPLSQAINRAAETHGRAEGSGAGMEELFESEVVWPENCSGGAASDIGGAGSWSAEMASRGTRSFSAAARPVEVPRAGPRRATGGEGGEEEEEEEWTPPHVLASRRRAEGMVAPFSVCSGHGRTLKGRDLRHVRDYVLRMTGFLEG